MGIMEALRGLIIGAGVSGLFFVILGALHYAVNHYKFKNARKPKVGEVWTSKTFSDDYEVEVVSSNEIMIRRTEGIIRHKKQETMK